MLGTSVILTALRRLTLLNFAATQTPPVEEAEVLTLTSLVHLKNLAIQVVPSNYFFSIEPYVPFFKSTAPLSSLSIRFVNGKGPSIREGVPMKDIIRPHASTLTHLMMNRPIDLKDLKKIASKCRRLYRLTTVVPWNEVVCSKSIGLLSSISLTIPA